MSVHANTSIARTAFEECGLKLSDKELQGFLSCMQHEAGVLRSTKTPTGDGTGLDSANSTISQRSRSASASNSGASGTQADPQNTGAAGVASDLGRIRTSSTGGTTALSSSHTCTVNPMANSSHLPQLTHQQQQHSSGPIYSRPPEASPMAQQLQHEQQQLLTARSCSWAPAAPADQTAPSASADSFSGDSRGLQDSDVPAAASARAVRASSSNLDQLQRFENLVRQMFTQQRTAMQQQQQEQEQQQSPFKQAYDVAPDMISSDYFRSNTSNRQSSWACNTSTDPVHPVASPPPPAAAAAAGANAFDSCSLPCTTGNQQINPIEYNSGYSSQPGGSGRLQPSHSTTEKQRRDRLNALIDQLAVLVPPADARYNRVAPNGRRPKHIVLSDTINLIKGMQLKLQLDQNPPNAGQQAATSPATSGGAHRAVLQGTPVAETHSFRAPMPDVTVEHSGRGTLLVRVICSDRPGSLLADVMIALRSISVAIVLANVTTEDDGTTINIVEVRVGDRSITVKQIEAAVHDVLLAQDTQSATKRLKQYHWG